MRLVKTPKRSLSSAITRGHSSGGKSHHPQRSTEPMTFICVDGEGTSGTGDHRYVLFGVGDKQIENPEGLGWKEVFEFLYAQYKPRVAYTGFFLGYDFTQIFKTLPIDKAWMLLTTEGRALRKHRIPGKAPHPVQYDGWQFDILGSKRLRIRPKDCDCEVATCKCKFRPWMYVCDTGAFFQASLLKVINPNNWAEGTCPVTPEEYAEIERGKDLRSTAVLDDDMRRYNRLENEVLARVLGALDRGLLDIGIHLPPSKWFGPGQAAQQWLKNEGVVTGEEVREKVPFWFLEAARMSYFGGWFEIFMHGWIPGITHEYDINSAYPSIIQNLPCLLHGEYSRGEGIPRVPDGSYCLVYAEIQSPRPHVGMAQHIGTMLHRDRVGRILRPQATAGWYWWHELKAAENAGLIKRLTTRNVKRFVQYIPCECPPPMQKIANLYDKRLQVGKKSPLGMGARLIYNSAYGKFAQSVGDPIFGNPIYASLITAGCRTLIIQAIGTHPKGLADVAMVATDAVFFLTQHPGLPVSTRLGEWDYKARSNLTLFKPGVYWDDSARESIAQGYAPSFKARGFSARDFASAIGRIDNEFAAWANQSSQKSLGGTDWQWPRVKFVPRFSMTTALQALRQGDWSLAGRVRTDVELVQDSSPWEKRTNVYQDIYDGRIIYRSQPYGGMAETDDGQCISMQPIPSTPYTKRFGMEDPWSDEYQEQLGITEDGTIADIFAWLMKGG